jgi:hypothetical protein
LRFTVFPNSWENVDIWLIDYNFNVIFPDCFLTANNNLTIFKQTLRLKYSPILILIAAFSSSSCKKEPNRTNGTTQVQVKALEFNSMGSNAGYKDRMDIHFDQLGRVTSMNAYNLIQPPGTPLYDSIFNIYFEYTGNAILPFKVTSQSYTSPSKEAHYFFYTGNDPIKDSLILVGTPNFFYRLSNISRIGNTITFKDTDYTPSTPTIWQTTFINGNFPNHIVNGASNYYDFDNGLNPLNNLNVAPIFYMLDVNRKPVGQLWSIWSVSNKNNVIRVKYDFIPSIGYARDTSFLYNYYFPDGRLQKRFWVEYNPTIIIPDTLDMIEYIYQ